MQIPLEKGYSQMDWMRLTKSHPDLAGKPCSFDRCSAILQTLFLVDACVAGYRPGASAGVTLYILFRLGWQVQESSYING